jgi:hypothetical protein
MTILKAEILAHLNSELNRSETNIDEHILEALKDLSMQDKFLWVEITVPTIIGRPYYSLPTDYKKLMTIKIADNTPLKKITWQYYQELIADQTSANYGEPDYFAIHGGFWYPYPIPDAIYNATLFYNAFVPESELIDEVETNAVDNISYYFSDIYRQAIYTLTKAHYCISKGLTGDATNYLTLFSSLILPPLQKLIERETKSIECQDL